MQTIVIEGVSVEKVKSAMPEALSDTLIVNGMLVMRNDESYPIQGWDIKTIENRVYILLPEGISVRIATALKHYLKKQHGLVARMGSYSADLGVWEARQAAK